MNIIHDATIFTLSIIGSQALTNSFIYPLWSIFYQQADNIDLEMLPKTKDAKKQQQQQEALFPAAEWAWLDQLIEDMADGGDETRRLPKIEEKLEFNIPVIKRQPSAKASQTIFDLYVHQSCLSNFEVIQFVQLPLTNSV